MARLFRDLKVNESDGNVYLTLYNRDGSAALRDVSVKVSSEVVQPGDNWTAAAANLLLRLDEEGAPQLALTPESIGAAPAADGMSLYTHKKSGTEHILTGSGNNIRFVAAADFAAGDTFRVNGTGCTARTVGGDALWAGFFRAGAVVVCYRTGNRLTFNGGGLPAAEAAKLAPENIKTGVSITANGKTVNGTFTADGTVAANQMLAGAVGYAKGRKVTGSIPSKGAASFRPGTASQTIAAGQYLSGAQTIEGDANLLAANIRQGVSIFGVAGALEPVRYHNANQSGSDSVGPKDEAKVLRSVNVTGYNLVVIRGMVATAGDLSLGKFVAGSEFAAKCRGYYASWEGRCALLLNGQSGSIEIGVRADANSSSMGASCRLDSIELYYVPGL